MTKIIESKTISGVYIAELTIHGDERGSFRETFRKAWFPQRSWDTVQTNCSQSAAGVVRGLHYHFKQVDYWYVPRGRLRAGLFDLRPNSPTYLASQTVEMGEENDIGLFIPIGVAHGFSSLTDLTLIYVVDNYHDGADEFGVAWNDPTAAIDWGVENPTISGRDAGNKVLGEVSAEALPL